eukprot:TRINITY_DN50734_c0_g1_i1.p1 TRINITY_DN50734_c0_g1~~TRINITY_DN50734_c0_g1_i1.p1  ORF type:complete len:130 (+),score=0.59 TRINITY_DN50734_c0_g1_i1:349-738(+)
MHNTFRIKRHQQETRPPNPCTYSINTLRLHFPTPTFDFNSNLLLTTTHIRTHFLSLLENETTSSFLNFFLVFLNLLRVFGPPPVKETNEGQCRRFHVPFSLIARRCDHAIQFPWISLQNPMPNKWHSIS